MTDMALIVPSRGRPQNIKRLVKGLIETQADVDLYVGVDKNDPMQNDYLMMQVALGYPKLIINFSLSERDRFGSTLNRLTNNAIEKDRYKYLAWCGDDHLPISKGWDKRYKEELDKGAGIVYGNDLVMGETIATQLAFTPDIPKALGYAVPTSFVHLFIDNYFMKLGEKIGGSVYIPDVIFQHLHPIAGAKSDKTYEEANCDANWKNDRAAFDDYMANQLNRDVEKINEYRKNNK